MRAFPRPWHSQAPQCKEQSPLHAEHEGERLLVAGTRCATRTAPRGRPRETDVQMHTGPRDGHSTVTLSLYVSGEVFNSDLQVDNEANNR